MHKYALCLIHMNNIFINILKHMCLHLFVINIPVTLFLNAKKQAPTYIQNKNRFDN